MKITLFVLSALVSAAVLGQTVPKPPSLACAGDQCVQEATLSTSSWSVSYADGFESGSLLTSLWTYSNSGTVTHSFPTGVAREGSRAHRCTLTWNSNSSFRCELAGKMLEYRGLNDPQFFKDTWWGFSINPGVDSIKKGCIYAQWHGYGGFGPGDESDKVSQPIFSLNIQSATNTWGLQGFYSPNQPSIGQTTSISTANLASVNWGKWTDFVFRIRWDYRAQPTAAGVVEVWVNGVKRYSKTDVSIGYNDNQLPYFKMGLYCAQYKSGTPTGAKRTVYNDAFRMTGPQGSYAAVAPRS